MLVALVLSVSAVALRAAEAEIPIEVDVARSVEVTEAQLDWIRTWLLENLHPRDLAGIEVDVRNRVHPGSDYRAEARLATRESGTYVVRRTIRFAHRSWPTWRVKEDQYTGDWAVSDRDVVQRRFDVHGLRHVMALSDDLSYEVVQRVLQAIATGRIEHAEDEEVEPQKLERVWWVDRETDGIIQIKSGHPWRGKWIGGHLEGDRFVVTTQGMYIS